MLKLKYILLYLIVFATIIIGYDYWVEDTYALEEAQDKSKDEFLVLDHGKTRYNVYGKQHQNTVVLIHGFNGFMECWTPNIPALVKSGHKVVVYDLWGRGLSDRPRTALTIDKFRTQLHQLIHQLDTDKVSLIGSSFGCVIATDYTLNYPDKIDKLVFVGPAGWPSLENKPSSLIHVPILSELAFHFFGKNILKPKVENYLFDKNKHYWAVEKWSTYAAYDGYNRAALSTLKHAPVIDYLEGWKKLGMQNKTVLCIWGKEDVSFHFSNTEKLKTFVPTSKITGIKEAAHWVNIEKPRLVNHAIVTHLSQ